MGSLNLILFAKYKMIKILIIGVFSVIHIQSAKIVVDPAKMDGEALLDRTLGCMSARQACVRACSGHSCNKSCQAKWLFFSCGGFKCSDVAQGQCISDTTTNPPTTTHTQTTPPQTSPSQTTQQQKTTAQENTTTNNQTTSKPTTNNTTTSNTTANNTSANTPTTSNTPLKTLPQATQPPTTKQPQPFNLTKP